MLTRTLITGVHFDTPKGSEIYDICIVLKKAETTGVIYKCLPFLWSMHF